ncbi:MAG TPA: right-handed parallel beta-helix repeat-containing protein [Pyrinomonadaceae bacterium]|nr:right-handed parallel beta-helix repeat-containing protein [Pyrinomonadaceae bacterium]
MKKTRFTIKALAFLVFTLAFASAAQAQASRTWVSGTGDDANPCSRTAPCKTFAGAISKTADQGEIDCIDPGGFGTVTITKSITIDGGGTFASILAAGTNGVNVNDSGSGAPGTKVVSLRNLSINGFGTGLVGISYTSAHTLHVENCVIFGFKGSGGNSHGIKVALTAAGTPGNGELTVKDTQIRDCTGDGINTTSTSGVVSVSINNSRTEKCANGMHFSNGTVGAVRDSLMNLNSNAGLVADKTSAQAVVVDVERCVIALNTTAGIQAGGGTSVTRLSNSFVVQNGNSILLAGGTVDSGGNNRFVGNTTNTNPNGTAFGPV